MKESDSSILLINNSAETFTADSSGAIATHISAVRQAASRQGWTCRVLTYEPTTLPLDDGPRLDVPAYADWGGPRVSRLRDRVARARGWRGRRSQAYYQAVRRRLTVAEGVRAIVLHNDPDVADRLARDCPKIQVLHVFHNLLTESWSAGSGVRHLAVSQWLADAMTDRLAIPVGVLRNGVDGESFRPAAKAAQAPRGTRVRVSFLGRTGREKGLDLLLDALLTLPAHAPNIDLLVIGANTWGPTIHDAYQAELRDRVRCLEERGAVVRCAGHAPRSEVAQLLRGGDVHVVPSRWEEPACLALTEAMASGLAVVAARSGGMPEYGGDACLWFDREDVDGLGVLLDRLLTDSALRHLLGERARRRAEQLTWDATWSGLSVVLEASRR